MTRKDYVRIAWIISHERGLINLSDDKHAKDLAYAVLKDMTALLADTMAQDNPRFDKERFITACEKDEDSIKV
jgi:hypothetical protein